jgi:hypothetical protein
VGSCAEDDKSRVLKKGDKYFARPSYCHWLLEMDFAPFCYSGPT